MRSCASDERSLWRSKQQLLTVCSLVLCAIDDRNKFLAIELLSRGFSNRTRAFWQASLANMSEAGGNAEAGIPIGYLLMNGSDPVGVMLTPASIRLDTDRKCRTINLSSWYIEPEYRWRGPLMLNAIIRGTDAIYTDLTPTASVQKMLIALGFKPINIGEVLVPLPQAALDRGQGARVARLDAVPDFAVSEEIRRTFSRHTSWGCVALALEVEGKWHPLLFKSCSRRGLPGVRLVYGESHALLRRWIGPVSRSLLKHGKLFLIQDLKHGEETSVGFARPGHAIKFAKGDEFTDRTDFTGTELCFFDF